MGVMVTDRRRGLRLPAAVFFGVTLVLLLLLPARASGSSLPLFAAGENASGRYDTVVLRDLGKRTAAVVSMMAANGSFTANELWRSRKGKLAVGKVKWLAADVNADGLADGVALIDLGHGQSRFVVYLNGGDKAVPKTAWTSKKKAFFWSRAKLAVGDVNGDGRDDIIALYDRGKAGVALFRFVSSGSAFKISTGWTASRASFSWAKAQLAAGDFSKDGRDDAMVLYKSTASSSQLLVFVSGASSFTRTEFWSGDYAATGVQLAAGDVDSDGIFDAVCLAPKPDGTGRLDVFISSGSAFAGPATWYEGSALPGTGARFVVGDLTGDGRADGLIARSTGGTSSSLVACLSTGMAFTPTTWWTGSWRYAGLRLGCAPSPGLVISDQAKVADSATLDALSGVAADGTLTFDRETAQLQALEPGDVLTSQPDAANPQGIFRKVTSVSESGGAVVVATSQATLDDVMESGEIGFVKHVTPEDLSQEDITLPGVRLTSGRGDPLITFAIETELKVPVGSVTETAVKLKGSVSLDPEAYFNFSYTVFDGLQTLSYRQVMNVTSDLDVEVTASLSKEIEQELIVAPLGTMMVVIPPAFPIWVTPTFRVYVGAGGRVTAGVTAGVTETCTADFSIGYDKGKFLPPTGTCTSTQEWRKPKLFGEVELRAYAGVGLDFLLYSIAGPYASLEAGPYLEAGTNRTPWWELYAAVDAEIGVKVDLFVAEYKSNFPPWRLFKLPIDWARTPYGTQGVSGKVTAADTGAPLAGAKVKLHEGAGNPDGTVVGTATTAVDGTYSFTGPPAGGYTLVASKSGYQSGQRDASVLANAMTEGQDIALTPGSDPGAYVWGMVVNATTRAGIVGATVEARRGADSPSGPLEATATTDGSGVYRFENLPGGSYTLVASKAGFTTNSATITVYPNDRKSQEIALTPLLPGATAQATDGEAFIRYLEGMGVIDAGGALFTGATYEFWFNTTVASEVERSGILAMVSMRYGNFPGGESGIAPIMKILVDGRGTITFGVNEYNGGGPLNGTWHFIRGKTEPQVGQWVHIAAQFGGAGLKLFVNGQLEASDLEYKGYPQPDWSDGTQSGGWFSLGDNDTRETGSFTARGHYKELRVSAGQRYAAGFTPPAVASQDGTTQLLDHLIGGTIGENHGFVWLP